MSKLDHLQQLHRLLKSHRRPVPLATLAQRLECSERTVRRLIDEMKTWFDAPLEYDKVKNGWHYADGDEFEIPGMWLTSAELQSLTLLLHVLESFGNGLLNDELASVEKQIRQLLTARQISPGAFSERIKVLSQTSRSTPGKIFQQVGNALLQREQIQVEYKDFSGRRSKRAISPQTLVYYRENWYLDAWCHLRNDLRTFSLARLERIQNSDAKAIDVKPDDLQQHFAASYGIFAGTAKHAARLRFLPQIAREIAQQRWHPKQQGEWDGDEYVLSFPYSDERELIGDIQRHLPNVIVEAPANLRKTIARNLRVALEQWAQFQR